MWINLNTKNRLFAENVDGRNENCCRKTLSSNAPKSRAVLRFTYYVIKVKVTTERANEFGLWFCRKLFSTNYCDLIVLYTYIIHRYTQTHMSMINMATYLYLPMYDVCTYIYVDSKIDNKIDWGWWVGEAWNESGRGRLSEPRPADRPTGRARVLSNNTIE